MPHIGAVMERSLQEPGLKDAFVRLFARSAVAAFTKRQTDIQGSISDAATAFSSWDNCMAATFCKWPVIGIMIIGGLIIFSIVWCIARCCCCGLSCCCECCYCLKCCGNCLGCCDPPRGKRHKYLDEPFVPPHHDQVYRSHEPMSLSNLPPTKAKADVPQYAVFESGDKKDADSLPAMPSWEGAGSQKVLIEEESVEMEPMKKPVHSQTNLLAQNNMSQATIPSPVSPASRSPYGPPPGQTESQGYMPAARAETDPYGTNGGYNNYDNGYGQASQDNLSQGYGNQNQGYGNQGYGMAGAGVSAAAPMGRRTPHQDYNDGYGQGRMDRGYPQSRTPRPYNDEYGRSGTPGSYNRGYRAPPKQ
ncbi:hypothetical protein F4778DRAFT_208621 [Xylariomycetidae sp. FL2044]|nr:hypothetical protein F4778DRAFT_208621 [Xylariomycetidae sp. FL2044]